MYFEKRLYSIMRCFWQDCQSVLDYLKLYERYNNESESEGFAR